MSKSIGARPTHHRCRRSLVAETRFSSRRMPTMSVDRQTLWGQMSRVAQASGMVSVQADCSCDSAMMLMQAEADRRGTNIEDLAKAVLARTVRFEPSVPEGPISG